MPKIKTGYSKNIMAHGKCRIVAETTDGMYVVAPIIWVPRPDGTGHYAHCILELVNKDEVSNIKEEEEI